MTALALPTLRTSFGVEYQKADVLGYECRHTAYCPNPNGRDDLHLVKEYIHLRDGRTLPHMRPLHNYKRSFWITRKGFQNHKDKKEYEELSHLQEFKTTQIGMTDAVSRALDGRPGNRRSMREIAKSPYLYGCDIETSALIKKAYQDKFPECVSPQASVAVFDIETDVIRSTGDVILATLSFGNRMITAINTAFINSLADAGGKVRATMDKEYHKLIQRREIEITQKLSEQYSGDELTKRVEAELAPLRRAIFKTDVDIVFCKNGAECIKACFQKAHVWSPDFVVIWNINFDIPYCIKILKEAGENLADIFSDPSLPEEYRYFNYIEGLKQKVTQDGKITPLHPAEQWHIVECPASFYFIDAMCMYLRLRIAKGKEPSYSLDAILKKHSNLGKLSLPECDHLDGLLWHKEMQRKHPFFYVVYNQFDCIGVEIVDEKNGDVARQFSILCGISDYRNFTKNPRRIVDDMHFFYLERGKVIGSTGAVGDENDEHVTSLRQWIVTLPAHLIVNNGAAIILELSHIRSMMRFHMAD